MNRIVLEATTGAALLALAFAAPVWAQSPPAHVKVDDPAATLKRAEALGGKTVVPATDARGGVTFARLADPEGNVIGVVRRPN